MKFTVVLEEAAEGGYVVQCVEIPGAISQGDTVDEALANVADAIKEILSVRRADAQRVAKVSHGTLTTVEVDA
jgi:predicted RNase H-like HicB family nuclease